jgi:hypothetical protein
LYSIKGFWLGLPTGRASNSAIPVPGCLWPGCKWRIARTVPPAPRRPRVWQRASEPLRPGFSDRGSECRRYHVPVPKCRLQTETCQWSLDNSDAVVGGTVTQLKASTGVTLNTFTVGKQPGGVAFNGASTWVTNFGGTAVSKLETEKCRNALLLRSSSLARCRLKSGANSGFHTDSFKPGIARGVVNKKTRILHRPDTLGAR